VHKVGSTDICWDSVNKQGGQLERRYHKGIRQWNVLTVLLPALFYARSSGPHRLKNIWNTQRYFPDLDMVIVFWYELPFFNLFLSLRLSVFLGITLPLKHTINSII